MADQVSDIATALNKREWLPSQEERALAAEFFAGLRRIPEQHLLPLPESAGLEPSWARRTCHLAARADLADALLAGTRFAGPMVVLLGEVAAECSPFRELATQLRHVWKVSPPSLPSEEDLGQWGDRAVQDVLRRWDLAHVSDADRKRIEHADGSVTMRVQSTMMAALTGGVDW